MPPLVPGTAEPPYEPPHPELRRQAERWLAATNPEALRALVTSLPGPRNRLNAPEAMAATDELLIGAWREAGWRTGRQRLQLRDVDARLDHPGLESGASGPHPRHRYARLDGMNVVAISEGDTDEAIVVVAHHDTVRGSPGADDNGAGLAALLELGRMLAGRRFRRTVILAAPDFEEIGLIGSAHLVRWLRSRYRVRGAIVFDPIGYMDPAPGTQRVPPGIDRLYPGQVARLDARGRAGDTVIAIHRHTSLDLVLEWARSLSAILDPDRILLLRDPLDLPIAGPALALVPVARNFSRSDHVRFWLAGMPAIQVTDTANFRNPHYHRPSDLPDTLDYATVAAITAATGLAVERLAGGRMP